MGKNKNLQLLKTSFIIFGVVALVYGILFLFIPEVLVKISGSDSVPSGWLRWSGGILTALGVGAFMALKNPSQQITFVRTLALVNLLCGLALLFALIFERVTQVWFTLIPAILNLIISALFWISLAQQKKEPAEKIEN